MAIAFTGVALQAQPPALSGGKMLDCSGLPCVDVTIAGGRHLRMLIDTGNVVSVVDSQLVKEAGLSISPAIGPDGKAIPGYKTAVLPAVKLGDASMGDLEVLVVDVAADVKANTMPEADGTLAYTAFKDRLLEMDYVGRTVRVSAPISHSADFACTAFCGDITTPTFGKHGPPIVVTTGFFVNGHPITAQIDTLFTGTTLIYPGGIVKLGLSEAAKTEKLKFFAYTDGGVQMLEASAGSEGFGKTVIAKDAPLFFPTKAVHLPDDLFDATVGNELFKAAVLRFDFHSLKFSLTNPS